MRKKWRRSEVLLPLQYNDKRPVPLAVLGEAVREIVAQFGAASYETQRVEGFWRAGGRFYRDDLTRLVVDLPDTTSNRQWMKQFKERWRVRLKQIELWMVSYRIEVE
jgi:hypothetical protein